MRSMIISLFRYVEFGIWNFWNFILGTLEFYEVGRTLLEGLHEETLGIVEFHEVGRTSLEGLENRFFIRGF